MIVSLKQKGMALLSYFLILVLVPLLTHRDDRFVHYHAKQGLVLMLCWIGFLIISLPLTYIPYAGVIVITVLFALLLILELICIIMVLLGKTMCIPIVGKYAEEWYI